ncbi:hypothetical protein [Nostoc sp.]
MLTVSWAVEALAYPFGEVSYAQRLVEKPAVVIARLGGYLEH